MTTKDKKPKKDKTSSPSEDNKETFNPFGAAKDMFNQFSKQAEMPKVNREAVMASHRKNLETLNEANKMAVDVMKSIATLQGQFMRQTFEDMNAYVKDVISQKVNPEAHSEKLKSAVSKAMEHSSNIANIMLKSNQDLFKTIQNRFEDGVEEMQHQMKAPAKKPTKH